MKVSILGTDYEIIRKRYSEDPYFEKWSLDGYCDYLNKVICIADMTTYPGWEEETEETCKKQEAGTLRHEIIHAFLNESGLQDSSGKVENIGWAKNEEMVDFFAIQFPKIAKVFETLQIMD